MKRLDVKCNSEPKNFNYQLSSGGLTKIHLKLVMIATKKGAYEGLHKYLCYTKHFQSSHHDRLCIT